MVVELSQVVEAVVVRRDEKDKWVWGGDSGGCYTVNSGYKALQYHSLHNVDLFYKLLWLSTYFRKGSDPMYGNFRITGYQPSPIYLQGVWCIKIKRCVCSVRRNQKPRNTCFSSVTSQLKSGFVACFGFGIFTALHCECKKNFFQFRGLVKGTSETLQLWQVVWFAIV